MNLRSILYGLVVCTILSSPLRAHFGMILPSKNVVTSTDRTVSLTVAFTHPFEQVSMTMEKPERIFVVSNGKKTSLLGTLSEKLYLGKKAWSVSHTPKRPGAVIYGMEPTPYWEPSEDCFIIHYTKAVIGAYGVEDGWDTPLGFPIEIVPLSRPFGVFEGTSFTGKVLKNNTPLADATVEYEYFNEGRTCSAPSDYHVTHTLKSSKGGLFTISLPKAGWWSVSALTQSDTQKPSENGMKSVELGGVIWIKVDPFK